jgi:hypothetical protein
MKPSEVPENLREMLGVLRTARLALEATLNDVETTIDRNLVDSISKLASAHASLSRESLRWDAKSRQDAGNASLEDRILGVLAFITKLPLGERSKIYQALVDFEQSAKPGLALSLL